MVSRHGILLAAHVVSSFYGDHCSKVCECLLSRGTLALAKIIQYTELSRENVMNCLRVLIHQNCVQAFAIQQEGAFGEASKIVTQYMALFDNMIHKLRAQKFMQIVSEELGKDCLEIFMGLIQHGRLSINQIIDRNEQAVDIIDVEVVRESFSRLLNARFIERCPAPEPFLVPEEPPNKKRSMSAKLAGEPTIEQRALAAAAPMESMRFLMDPDAIFEKKGGESTNNVKLGKKRKQDVLKLDEDELDANRKKEVLWRVNFEEFVCRLRHKACVSYVKTDINDEAGIVVKAILDLSRRSKTQPKAERSAYLSINDIYDEVIKKEGGLGMDLESIRASLLLLRAEDKKISTELDGTYSIDIKKIIELAQTREVESVVLRRYGSQAFSIFRALLDADMLETNMIADKSFVEKHDLMRILLRLWKEDFLRMEKVTISAAAKQSVFLQLWQVNKDSLWPKVVDEMYNAALNIRLRNAHEQDQGKEVLQLPREKLVGDLEKKYKHLVRVKVILESSMVHLDDAIMLFHDFSRLYIYLGM